MMEKCGRLDIIEQGKNINFEIVENKENFQIRTITWFSDKSGIVLDEIDPVGFFIIKANDNINLRFNLKGIDRRTPDNKFIEKWCTFIVFKINGVNMLSEPKKVWHNQGFDINCQMKKDEVIKIEYQYETELHELIRELNEQKKEILDLKYVLGQILWENKKIKILTQQETIDNMLNQKLSIARFGDGEIRWMLIKGFGGGFQKYNEELSNRLHEVLNAKNKHLLVCIAGQYNPKSTRSLYWEKIVRSTLLELSQNIEDLQVFGDTNITRNANNVPHMKQIWQDKDIVVVEGELSRLGVGNDLFDNVKSLKRILCPAENAFDKYDEIFAECLKQPKEKLFLLALGPTATVLAYDLCNKGYQALDVGHIDICYEWKLRGAAGKIAIPGKYVNEAKGGRNNIEDCTDENYLNSIITKIL